MNTAPGVRLRKINQNYPRWGKRRFAFMSARSRVYSCIIAMHKRNNCVLVCVCVYVWDLPWTSTVGLEPKSHSVFHGVLADFFSASFIKRAPSRPAVPTFCVQRRARPDGNCVRATSYPANRASQNQLYCIKNRGIQRLSCSQSISGALEDGKFKPGARVLGEVTAASLASISEPSSN